MSFRIRRPIIWALGILILVLMVFNALGNPVYYRTSLDDEMGVLASGENEGQISGEGGSKSAHVTAVVKNITNSETGIKVTLNECVVKFQEGSNESVTLVEHLLEENDLKGEDLKGEDGLYEPHGLVAYFDSEGTFAVGDKILVSGKLKCIDRPDNPGEFDSWQYYRCRGIDYTLYPDSCEVIEAGSGIKAALYKVRQSLYDAVDEVSESDEEAGLFKAALFGDKSEVDEDTYASFQICGIAHVLAVGGLHLTVLAEFVRRILEKIFDAAIKCVKIFKNRNDKLSSRNFPCGATYSYFNRANVARIFAAVLADVFLLLFVIMIDGSVSAWRAYIMFTLMLMAPMFGRTYDILSALGLAGIMILVSEPLYALDCAFQLSFAAIFGVGVVAPRLKMIAEELRPREANGRKKDLGFIYYRVVLPLVFSLSIQLMTIPVMLLNFYSISLYGILLNLVVIPCMSLALASIFMGASFVAAGGAAWGGAAAAASAAGASAVGASAIVASSGTAGNILAAASASSGNFFVNAGRFLAGVAHYFFKALVSVCDFVESLPGASIVLGKPPVWKIIFYYMVLAIMLIILGRPLDEFVRDKLENVKKKIIRGSTSEVDYEVPVRIISKRFLAAILIVPMLIIFVPLGSGIFGTDTSCKSAISGVGLGSGFSGSEVSLKNVVSGGELGSSFSESEVSLKNAESGGELGSGFSIERCLGMDELVLAGLYVGQGDCTVVTLPNRHGIIIDAGSSSKKKVAKNVIIPYLKSSAITVVDMIILSHPDIDHINGVVGIIESPQVSVRGVAVAQAFAANSAWDEIKAACAEAAVPFYYMNAGDSVSFANGTVTATAVAPRASATTSQATTVPATTIATTSSSSKNDGSLVMRLSYRLDDKKSTVIPDSTILNSPENSHSEFSALFTGDISSEEESALIKSGALVSANYLKCPHHGSKYSSSEAFLTAVQPLITTVSAGRGNTYGHPTKAALDRIAASGSATFVTKTEGAILTTVTHSGKISVTPWR